MINNGCRIAKRYNLTTNKSVKFSLLGQNIKKIKKYRHRFAPFLCQFGQLVGHSGILFVIFNKLFNLLAHFWMIYEFFYNKLILAHTLVVYFLLFFLHDWWEKHPACIKGILRSKTVFLMFTQIFLSGILRSGSKSNVREFWNDATSSLRIIVWKRVCLNILVLICFSKTTFSFLNW